MKYDKFFEFAKQAGIQDAELYISKSNNLSFSLFHGEIDNYSVEDGQVLIIDSRSTQPWNRRVYLVAGQTVINVFDYRDPAGSILKKIPPGDIAIGYARTYGIELTVYKERSEPEWITS